MAGAAKDAGMRDAVDAAEKIRAWVSISTFWVGGDVDSGLDSIRSKTQWSTV